MPASAAVASVRRMSGLAEYGLQQLGLTVPFWNLSPFPAARTTASRTGTDEAEFTTTSSLFRLQERERASPPITLHFRGSTIARHFVGRPRLRRGCWQLCRRGAPSGVAAWHSAHAANVVNRRSPTGAAARIAVYANEVTASAQGAPHGSPANREWQLRWR